MKYSMILVVLTICSFIAVVAEAENSAGNNTTSYWNDQGGLFRLKI